MKTFRLKADLVFDAEDIDHAIEMLGDHFRQLGPDGDDYETLDFIGEITLQPEAE